MLAQNRDVPTMDAQDRAFHYGDGLFETFYFPAHIVSLKQHPLWQYHKARIEHGCERLNLTCPSFEDLAEDIMSHRSCYKECLIKIILSRKQHTRGYKPSPQAATQTTLFTYEYSEYSEQSPVAITRSSVVASKQPLLAGLKHLNRLESVLAAQEIAPPYFEALLCDDQNQVVEGTRTNVFAYFDQWVTPPLTQSGVKGVARAYLLDHLSCQEDAIDYERLKSAESLFLCNSVLGIVPVNRLDQQSLDPTLAIEIQKIWKNAWGF